MGTMSDSETERYNGYANRETWAFNLHWQNDQGLYNETLEAARGFLRSWEEEEDHNSDFQVGEFVVSYWRDMIDAHREEGIPLHEGLQMFEREVGSWWRIDYAEVGEAVRESLDTES